MEAAEDSEDIQATFLNAETSPADHPMYAVYSCKAQPTEGHGMPCPSDVSTAPQLVSNIVIPGLGRLFAPLRVSACHRHLRPPGL